MARLAVVVVALAAAAFAAAREAGPAEFAELREREANPLLSKLFREAPKVELHTHLDGAMRPATLCELAIKNHKKELLNTTFLSMPPPAGCRLGVNPELVNRTPMVISGDDCPAELTPYVTSFNTSSLTDFLQPFPCVGDFLVLPHGLEAMGGAFVPQQVADNVIYSEAQFAPQTLLRSCSPFVDCDAHSDLMGAEVVKVVQTTIDAIVSAGQENHSIRVLLDCLRNINVSFCEQLLDVAIAMKESEDEGVLPDGSVLRYAHYIVGVNLAGDEISFPNDANPGGNESFKELFARKSGALKAAGLGFAPHSGEPAFPQSAADCASAIDEMGAARVGHGYHCSEESWQKIARQGLHIEVCPSSSMATGAVNRSWADHPIRTMQRLGVSISLHTDDRAIIGTNMTQQYELAFTKLNFSLAQLVAVAVDGNNASFASQATKEAVCERIKSWWAAQLEANASVPLREVATSAELASLVEYLDAVQCRSAPASGGGMPMATYI